MQATEKKRDENKEPNAKHSEWVMENEWNAKQNANTNTLNCDINIKKKKEKKRFYEKNFNHSAFYLKALTGSLAKNHHTKNCLPFSRRSYAPLTLSTVSPSALVKNLFQLRSINKFTI